MGTTILVTGAEGFIGKNLMTRLSRRPDLLVRPFDVRDSAALLQKYAAEADVVFHLAGANRPARVEEFETVNAAFTGSLLSILTDCGRRPTLVYSSSIQADLDNPYGRSKLAAEQLIRDYTLTHGTRAFIFRLPNVFGKWCRPDYNSVVATFCRDAAIGRPLKVVNRAKRLSLVYIDDVLNAFADVLDDVSSPPGCAFREVAPVYRTTVGALAQMISRLAEDRARNVVRDLGDPFYRCMQSTYISYLPEQARVYGLTAARDPRGALAEFLQSRHFGQVFVSTTAPGCTRGNHFHDTKAEKFCVLAGEAVVRLTPVTGGVTTNYQIRGSEFSVIDIPPGYAHSISNVGCGELVVLFWANEPFDPLKPDTYATESIQ